MDRRAFLVGSACGVGAVAVARPAHGLIAKQATQVLQLDPGAGVWRPFQADMAIAEEATAQRMRLLGPRLVDGSRLLSLQLDLLFDTGDTQPARHCAWRFDASHVEGNSGDCSFRLPARGLALEFRLAGSADARPAYLKVDAARWPEGDYLVRLDAGPVRTLDCDPAGSCAAPAGIDVFLLQVRAEPEPPELCLRADLACQRQDQASA